MVDGTPPGSVSLRDYIERLLDEREKALLSQQAAADRARENTADALRARLEQMNEFRQQILEERALYVRRDMLEPLVSRIRKLEETESNLGGRFWMLAAVMTASASIITAALVLFVNHLMR